MERISIERDPVRNIKNERERGRGRERDRERERERERNREREMILPAFGTPTRPTSATSFSSSLSHLFSPPCGGFALDFSP